MLQKNWYKLLVWFLATFFFYLSSGVVISIFRPGPSEVEVKMFMSGMMGAMDKSMMGIIMNIAHNEALKRIILLSAYITIPAIIIGIYTGFIIRYHKRRNINV